MRWTIQRLLLALVLLGSAMAALVGAVGYRNTTTALNADGELLAQSAALRQAMLADMMHDALRGDVLRAIFAARATPGSDDTRKRGANRASSSRSRSHCPAAAVTAAGQGRDAGRDRDAAQSAGHQDGQDGPHNEGWGSGRASGRAAAAEAGRGREHEGDGAQESRACRADACPAG